MNPTAVMHTFLNLTVSVPFLFLGRDAHDKRRNTAVGRHNTMYYSCCWDALYYSAQYTPEAGSNVDSNVDVVSNNDVADSDWQEPALDPDLEVLTLDHVLDWLTRCSLRQHQRVHPRCYCHYSLLAPSFSSFYLHCHRRFSHYPLLHCHPQLEQRH